MSVFIRLFKIQRTQIFFNNYKFCLPDMMAKLKTLANAVIAWKAGRLGQVGASATATPSSRRQADSSAIPLVWSNSQPNIRVPQPLASPIQTTVVDI